MNVNHNVNLDNFSNMIDKELSVKKPRSIKFVSAQNAQMNAVVSVNLNDIDGIGVAEVIAEVIKDGGIFGNNPDTGEHFFIPWPCAIVIISN